jgi:hypothetical protein
MLPNLQISLVFATQLAYVVIVNREFKQKRIFETFFVKLKFMLQDFAILFFCLVLTIFSFTQSTEARNSKTFEVLEYMVIVAVIIAIGSEVLTILTNIYTKIKSIIKKIKEKKKQKKMDKSIKEFKTKISDIEESDAPAKKMKSAKLFAKDKGNKSKTS